MVKIADEITQAFFEGMKDFAFGAYGHSIIVFTQGNERYIRAIKNSKSKPFNIATRKCNSKEFIWHYGNYADSARLPAGVFDELYNALVCYEHTSPLPESQMQTIDDLWGELWD